MGNGAGAGAWRATGTTWGCGRASPRWRRAINADHRNPRYLCDVVLSRAHRSHLRRMRRCWRARCAAVDRHAVEHHARRGATGWPASWAQDFPVVVCSKGVEEGSGLLPVEVFEAEMGNAHAPGRALRPQLRGRGHHAASRRARWWPAPTRGRRRSSRSCSRQRRLPHLHQRRRASAWSCAPRSRTSSPSRWACPTGIGFGDNTAAMLMTRGIAEMSRLVVRCGGQALTCMGLAGTGDLVATCTSEHSRNRRFGKLLAEGGTLEEFTGAHAHGGGGRAGLPDAQDAGRRLRGGAAHHRCRAQRGVGGRRSARAWPSTLTSRPSAPPSSTGCRVPAAYEPRTLSWAMPPAPRTERTLRAVKRRRR